MLSDHGTDGISHTIHVATEDDGELTNFRKFENVLDVMNLPNGAVKFYYENEEKIIPPGRIVRSTVRGVKNAFRYRCSNCEDNQSDIISQSDRGGSISMSCTVCSKVTDHQKRDIEDI